jgi:hypothetical protein
MMGGMKQQQVKRGRGRPKMDPAKQLRARHVVNLTPEVDAAVAKFCDLNGVGRHVDGMRQLIVKALKAEGIL